MSFSKRSEQKKKVWMLRKEGCGCSQNYIFREQGEISPMYEGEASKAFKAISKSIKIALDDIHSKHRSIFDIQQICPKNAGFILPSAGFIEVQASFNLCKSKNCEVGFIEVPDYRSAADYHSACIVASTTGTPIHKIKPGPKIIGGERVQLNKEPLDKYRNALEQFVNCL